MLYFICLYRDMLLLQENKCFKESRHRSHYAIVEPKPYCSGEIQLTGRILRCCFISAPLVATNLEDA